MISADYLNGALRPRSFGKKLQARHQRRAAELMTDIAQHPSKLFNLLKANVRSFMRGTRGGFGPSVPFSDLELDDELSHSLRAPEEAAGEKHTRGSAPLAPFFGWTQLSSIFACFRSLYVLFPYHFSARHKLSSREGLKLIARLDFKWSIYLAPRNRSVGVNATIRNDEVW